MEEELQKTKDVKSQSVIARSGFFIKLEKDKLQGS